MNDKRDENNNQNSPDDLGSDPDVPILHIPPSDHPHRSSIEAQHRHHYINRGTDFIRKHWPTAATWNAFGSLVTAFATVVMVIVYFQIKGIMNSSSSQTDELIKAAHAQAGAATKSSAAADSFALSAKSINQEMGEAVLKFDRMARASEQSIKGSIEQFRDEQRAWLGATKGIVDDTSTPIRVSLELANTGRSPALNVIQTPNRDSGIRIGPASPIKYTVPIVGSPINYGAMPPGIALNILFEYALPVDFRKPGSIVSTDFNARALMVYSGRFTYNDISRRRHWTRYCYYVVAPIPYNSSAVRTSFCPYGNDTDDDPQPDPKEGAMISYP